MLNPATKSFGILAFTPSLQLLCMTNGARQLCDRLNRSLKGAPVTGVLPRTVMQLCEEVATRLRTRADPKDWEEPLLTRVVGAREGAVLLFGLGLPGPPGLGETRILVLMEELDSEQTLPRGPVRDHYHLTEREQIVVIYLVQGLTNKEMARRLDRSEYTIKAHLKRLMQKTKAGTRAGLVAKILLAGETRAAGAVHK